MRVICFDLPDTWLDLVDSALISPIEYLNRLKAGNLEYSCWDCSGLEDVFDDSELDSILAKIEKAVKGNCLGLYHGCRLEVNDNPSKTGLNPSSIKGITSSLFKLAKNDIVLRDYLKEIEEALLSEEFQLQADLRDGQIWFCLTFSEVIQKGRVYVAFGSEYRLNILNAVKEDLKFRLFNYSHPSILSFDIPIDEYLYKYNDRIAKFLFSLWIHYHLKFDDSDKPEGFACYLTQTIPAHCIKEIIKPERVYDRFNNERRWYTYEEMCP
ncbi:MAG TPA: hypothetical protein VFG10_17730 [Saprospiraceae bacterium]|nr:hypothetical protein [Saprospiraceae bacterium]